MGYQVLARKYRPQRFDDVVGQRGVTQTLQNALTHGRLAQSFVFAGPRGVGKTTTARILARALNCQQGPTADPCGTCDACVEITAGRDIDVLEIDAATHTKVETIREVIVNGLAIAPVRNRYKVFIIDEVHQLSSQSFNALLKSIEEPPPHVMFMMATTELEKIPETIRSRSQVYELRTISRSLIVTQLRVIADAEAIVIDEEALNLIARDADGSMRDAQSAFDQVRAFAGDSIVAEDVSTVLGLIGREPVLDVAAAVVDEDAPAAFDLVGRFIEAGYDLKLVCRELSRVIRDLLVLAIDPARADDPEITVDSERDRLLKLSKRFSREDLLRAFDVIARAEFEIRTATQPRYHLEMALLRWMHLQKLVPLTDLLEGRGSTTGSGPSGGGGAPVVSRRQSSPSKQMAPTPKPPVKAVSPESSSPDRHDSSPAVLEKPQDARSVVPVDVAGLSDQKAKLMAAIKQEKKFFYGTVVAQAQRIELAPETMTFTFTPGQKTLAAQLAQNMAWLEEMVETVLGRKLAIRSAQGIVSPTESLAPTPSRVPVEPVTPEMQTGSQPVDTLRPRVMNDTFVKAMVDVLSAEIDDVQKL
ncbi:MAG: DNA polymerase III subunit gamma/tau [Planctomycetaceae bacterium]